LLANDDIRSIVTGMSTLPAQPRMYQEITAALSKPDVGIGAVADILEHDVAMCANILHLVNSAFFAAPRRLPDIESAVTFLGTTMLKQLVLSVEAFRTWETIGVSGLDLEALTQHGFLTANLARRLLSNKRDAEDAFMAAMLHDIGKLVLATACPEQMAAVSAVSTTDGRPLEVVERERLGVSHGPVGAYLLGLWGIPHPIVEAVARHDSPMNVPQQSFGILGAVYVADHLINEQSSPSTGPVSEVQEPLDTAYLERLGVAGRIPEWRLLAQDLTSMNEAI
jgi:HD-like signal output (HDOD) protein